MPSKVVSKVTPSGLVISSDENGERSSLRYGKAVLAHAVAELDGALASKIEAQSNWRHEYADRFVEVAERSLGAGQPDAALSIARRGLSKSVELIEFFRDDGVAVPLCEALSNPRKGASFATGIVHGAAENAILEVEVPYRGRRLTGDALASQLDAWAREQKMEQSCAEGVKAIVANSAWLDLSSHTFVILGAGSELGPLEHLLRAGATVLAVATRRTHRWRAHISLTRATRGTLVFPCVRSADQGSDDDSLAASAGCDLCSDLPEILAWITQQVAGVTGPLTVGTYLYADGELNTRSTLASDAIIEAIASAPSARKPSFSWIASAAIAAVLPESAYKASQHLLSRSPWWHSILRPKLNHTREILGGGSRICEGYLLRHGPNYALAQQLRTWRAIDLAARGYGVSMNVAPGCRTASVMKNAAFSKALDGYAHIAPLEAFEARTVKAIMFFLLVSDLSRERWTETPFSFAAISDQAFHAGQWSCPYSLESLSPILLILGSMRPRL